MAAATDKPPSGSLGLTCVGRNIFQSQHLRLSPMSQFKNLPCSHMNVPDGSDPPSPPVEDVPSPAEGNHLTTIEAHRLARDFIMYKIQPEPPAPEDEAARTLRQVGDEAVQRHQTVVNAIAKRLQYSEPGDECASPNERMFLMIAPEIYHDGQENWGRIVMLYVLGSILAQNDIDKCNGSDVQNIIRFVGNYVGTKKRKWIETHGGWDGFVKFFDNGASEEKKVWKGLLAAVGIGAIATSFSLAR